MSIETLAVETATLGAVSYEIVFDNLEEGESSAYGSFVCMVDVPSYMIPRDILTFFGSYLGEMNAFQVFRHVAQQSKYAAIIEMANSEQAISLISDFSGQQLSSLEAATCEIVRVKSVEIINGELKRSGGEEQEDFLTDWRMTPHAETCPLCLEPLLGSLSASASPSPSPTPFLSHMSRLSPPTIPGAPGIAAQQRGYFSTCCKHNFHADCLLKLMDPQCPVCRFQHDNEGAMMSECSTCGWRGRHGTGIGGFEEENSSGGGSSSHNHTGPGMADFGHGSSRGGIGGDRGAQAPDEGGISGNITSVVNNDLWMCLVCGYVGCGLSNQFHIRTHYLETLHAYVVNLDSKRVWDFAGNGYVHRLVMGGREEQNQEEEEDDGRGIWRPAARSAAGAGAGAGAATSAKVPKVVEVADPRASRGDSGSNERPTTPSAMSLSSMEEEALIHSNLESIAGSFQDHLLARMRQRRRNFDEQVKNIRHFSRNINFPQAIRGSATSTATAGSGGDGDGKEERKTNVKSDGQGRSKRRKGKAKGSVGSQDRGISSHFSSSSTSSAASSSSWSQTLLASLKAERAREEGRVKLAAEKLNDAREELDIVTRLNEMLVQNETEWQNKVRASEQELHNATLTMKSQTSQFEREIDTLMDRMNAMEAAECDAPTGEGEAEEDIALAAASNTGSNESAGASSGSSSRLTARRRGG